MVHAVQKRLNINNHISIAAIDYIKKLFVYAFIVIRHVLSKCLPVCCLKKRMRWLGSEKLKSSAISLTVRLENSNSFFSSSSRRCFIKWVADTPNWAFTELLSVMRLTWSMSAYSCTRWWVRIFCSNKSLNRKAKLFLAISAGQAIGGSYVRLIISKR